MSGIAIPVPLGKIMFFFLTHTIQFYEFQNVQYMCFYEDDFLSEGGPGKLLMFGVRENPKIGPQIRKVAALKSAHLDRLNHVISQKGNFLFFSTLLRSLCSRQGLTTQNLR